MGGPISWVGRVSGDLWGRAIVLARLMESQIWHLSFSSVSLWGEGSEKQQWPLSTFLSVESCPPALTLMPDTSVSPCKPLVPFKLLPQCWSSEGMSLSTSMYSSFRGTAWDSSSFFHQLNPHFLQPEVMGTYLPGTGNLGWRAWYWPWTSCS